MQSKVLLKQVLIIIILSGGIFFVVLLLNFISKDSTQGNSALLNVAAVSSQEQGNVELPVYLKIPSIEVDAPIEYVGLTSRGAMDVPEGPAEVAWFNLGPRPGENGSAVMAGHYGWRNNTPAVFDDLHKLRVGDKIFVEDADGAIMTFVVREMKTYGKDEIVPDVFSSSDGKAYLNLVTCTGTWNKVEKTRSSRLVVFTEKE